MSFTTPPSIQWWDEHAEECANVLDERWTIGVPILREEISQLRDGALVLDIGCYHGRLERFLAPHFQRVSFIGVDPGERIIAEAQRRRNETALTNIMFYCNDGYHLDSEADDSIDLVFSVATFQHLPEPTARNYVHEIRRVLRPGGVMCVQTVGSSRRASHMTLVAEAAHAGLDVVGIMEDPDAQPGWAWRWVKARKKA